MVSLLADEAVASGTPLGEDEKRVLASEVRRGDPVSEDLRQRAKKLIEQMLARERAASTEADPKSFANSMEWAGDLAYPNIIALTEEVITAGGLGRMPTLHGRAWLKDRAQLIGCAVLAVLFMMLAVLIGGLIFPRK